MKKTLMILIILVPGLAWGQQASEVPQAEVFAGASYLNIDTNGATSRQSAPGWETSVSANLTRQFAIEADFSGYYKNYHVGLPGGTITANTRYYGYVAGPRVNFRPFFIHALFGGDHTSASSLGISVSDNAFAAVAGGGVQIPISHSLSFRASADYAFTHHQIVQNNFRASAGIVFNFGSLHSGRTAGRAASPPPGREPSTSSPSNEAIASRPSGESVALSLGLTGYGTGEGFKVTSVREGSPAAQIFIRPGDTLSKIGDRAVKTGEDIDSAITASTTPTVKITGLTQTAVGMIQFEREVKIR